MPRLFKEVPRPVYAEFVKYHTEHNHAKDNAVEADTMSAMQTHIDGSVIAQAVYTKRDGQPVGRRYEVRVLEPKDVRDVVEKITALSKKDAEAASGLENNLLYDVLFAVKNEAISDPAKCVAAVLEVRYLSFNRC